MWRICVVYCVQHATFWLRLMVVTVAKICKPPVQIKPVLRHHEEDYKLTVSEIRTSRKGRGGEDTRATWKEDLKLNADPLPIRLELNTEKPDEVRCCSSPLWQRERNRSGNFNQWNVLRRGGEWSDEVSIGNVIIFHFNLHSMSMNVGKSCKPNLSVFVLKGRQRFELRKVYFDPVKRCLKFCKGKFYVEVEQTTAALSNDQRGRLLSSPPRFREP